MGAGEAAEEGGRKCNMFVFPLSAPPKSSRLHATFPSRARARTTMMNATVITSYFFLGLSLHFALSEDGFTTAPSSVPSSARSFVPPFFNWEYFVGLVLAAAAAGSN